MKKDIRVEVRFKNNNLYKKIFARYNSVSEFCREHNLHQIEVGKYLNLKKTPIAKGRRGSVLFGGYYIKKSAMKIANALNCNIFDIFPSEIWGVVSRVYSFEICSKNHLPYNDKLQIEELGNDFSDMFNMDNIEKVLHTLTPREEALIRMRFFKNESLEDVGNTFNITRERVRQIEGKALRKLRHPSRSRMLRNHPKE